MLKETSNAQYFFSSDHHFWHANIIKFCNRPFESVEDMNLVMLERWNAVVYPEDTVYYLGDFSLAFRPVETFSRRLNGIKYLIPGNHDFCHSYHKKSRKESDKQEWIKKYEEYGWNVLPEQTTLKVGDITFNLCHHPYYLQEQFEDKYKAWRPKDDGKWLLSGHVHEKWKIKNKNINIGVDQWDFYPVPLSSILELIKE